MEREALRAQFLQSQKMEVVGQLAGGIAHDFNNIMTAILGCARFLKEDIDAGKGRIEDIEEIIASANRAADLTKNLLSLSRRQVLRSVVVSLDTVIAEMEKMLRRIMREDIELLIRLESGLRHVKVDPGQIEQVILNLVINARDAMPKGGRLTIKTVGVLLDGEYCRRYAGVRPGDYVMLQIGDTGIGMDKVTQEKIFEPFFTTKSPGKGTGLGLSTADSIIRQSAGHITLESEPGRGSTFCLYFPVVAQTAVIPFAGRQDRDRRRGSETVLVIEDENVVRSVIKRILEKFGYTVLEAGTAQDAALLVQKHKGSINLVLSDVVLPDSDGLELFERLAPELDGVKVIFMSGYPGSASIRREAIGGGLNYIHKPFTPEALIDKVRDTLDAPPGD